MRRFVFLIVAVLASAPARAVTECGFNFASCAAAADRVGASGSLDNIDDGWAVGWFDGFVNGIAIASVKRSWCPRNAWGSIQVDAVVSKYMRDHPAEWDEQPVTLVLRALGQAFPCERH
jgi:hypothetical protein